MFERPHGGERAVIVNIKFYGVTVQQDLQEFTELVHSAGAEDVALVVATRQSPHARFFIGSGKVDEIHEQVKLCKADVVLFNHALSPAQERNLEASLQCRVLDRTGLILDIFAQRARTHEGKLQVELAQLRHLSTRLVRGWTHLERQKGGIGLRGPGETQLETDRRLLNIRIKQLNKRLERVQNQREQGRRARKRADLPTISLVGYTNAGKSTLFNALTTADVYTADQLFATLDATLRRVELPNSESVILADTVGFIRDLPHDLVAAFRSTLQETRDADLLLHVIDASSDNRLDNIEQVNKVLCSIAADTVPQIEIFNKIDVMPYCSPRIERNSEGNVVRVWCSALSGDGLIELEQVLSEILAQEMSHHKIALTVIDGKLRARCFELAIKISEQHLDDGNILLDFTMKRKDWMALCKTEQITDKIVDTDDTELAIVAQAQ